MYKFPHKLPNDLRLDLGKSGNFKKNPKTLGFDGEYLAGHQKAKF